MSIFCLFLVTFSKTPKMAILAIFACLATRLRASDKKVTFSNFKIDHFSRFFTVFSWFRALFHSQHDPAERYLALKGQTGPRQNRQKSSKIIKNPSFSDKISILLILHEFWSFWAEPLYRHHVPFFIFESKILFQFEKTWNFVNFCIIFTFFIVPKNICLDIPIKKW